ncbi:gem-associated protein 5-like [Asterias rubens]|uniref:gem-associated protein 5-like n=1 Tax=Asterias rubens TaxID=7604 RepID=UPI001454FE8F|nr:gem-associated protein 5-like [Asterias rubens]
MVDDLLPPSPNWYCSQASDCSEDGLFAYSTRSVVFLLDLRTSPPCYVGCLAGQAGHSNRVTAVKFGHGIRGKHLCATAGDDCTVRVWDVIGRAMKTEHHFHKEVKVTTIQWSTSQVHQGLVVSGDERGTLIWWNPVSGENREFVPERRPIGSLASCPHDGDYIAVGYKTGLVLILDISGKGQIIHKLRGHDDEVQSICWSPALGENIRLFQKPKEETTQLEEGTAPEGPLEVPQPDAPAHLTFREHGCLLISGCRDRTIRVWNTTHGKAVLTLSLPPRGGAHRTRERGEEGIKARVWLGLCWPQNRPREFISSSYGGDVLQWNLSKPGRQKWEYFGSEDSISHNRIVFNIINSCSQDMVITTSMDRQIICWNTKTLKPIWSIPTLGGFVYSLATCPVDPGCVALGVGDNMIRVWNTSAAGKSYAVNILWQGIKSKVTVLSWHPERDNCLAYGTDDGRVGIYNTFNQGKGPHLSSTFHKKTVYSLSWGPQCPAKEGVGLGTHCLYSCSGDGIIYQHDPSKLGEDAANFNSLVRSTNKITHMLPLHTDVSWRDDGVAVATGNEDGSIDVYAAPNLLLLCTIQVHHKLINCLQWYPNNSQSGTNTQLTDQSDVVLEDDLNGSNKSGKRYWLASGSNEPQVQVHDLTPVLGEVEPVQMKAPMTSSFRTLNGHTLRITALSWSPHGNGHLVSASYDYTAQVWDVLKGEPIANFRGHLGRLFSVAWSVIDPDIIFSGGEDFCLMKWRISKTQHTKPPTHKRNIMMTSRPGKGKPSSKNKKKSKILKDTSSEGSTPPRPSTPEVPAKLEGGTPLVPGTHSRNEPPASGSDLAKSSEGDACDLQRLVVAKRLELQVAVAVDSSEQKRVTETNCSSELGDADRNERQTAVAEGSESSRVKDSDMTSDFQSRDAPDAAAKKDGRRRKKQKSLFPMSRNQDNRGKIYHLEDCIALASHKYSSKETQLSASLHPGVGDNVHLGLFADRRAAYAMFKEEGGQHEEGGYPRQNLEMWKGNLAGALTQATEHNQLNSFLVAMSPLGGHDVWLETTEAYARQLEMNEDYTQAATYYLACHKIHKAIKVLQDNKLYREAVALASVRLSPFDEAFTNVYKAWASHLESEGNYGPAAKCYLTINQPADAVMLLARKSDIPSLSTALHVACISGQSHLTNGLLVRYLHECLMAGDWLNAQGLLANRSSLMFGSLVATMHEIIVTTLTHQAFISEELFKEAGNNPWIQEQCQNKTQCTPHGDLGTFLERSIHEWFKQCTLDSSDEGIVHGLYDAVVGIKQPNAQHGQTKQLLVELAFELTLGQLSVMMDCPSKAVAHWLQAIVMCHSVWNMDIARGIFSLILPEGSESIKQLLEGSTVESTGAITSLQAHFMLTELYHLWWGVGNQIADGKSVMVGAADASYPIEMMKSSSKAPSISGVNAETNQTDHQSTSVGTKLEPDCNGAVSEMTGKQNEVANNKMTESEMKSSQKMVDSEHKIYSLSEKLSVTSHVLLSEPHARLSGIRGRLQYIQMAVGRLVSQHCQEGQQEVPLPQDPTQEVLLPQDPTHKVLQPQEPAGGTVSDKHRDPLDPVNKVSDDTRTSGDIPQGRKLTQNGDCEDAVVQQLLPPADVKGQTRGILNDKAGSAASDITPNGKIPKENSNKLINDGTELSEGTSKALGISSAVDISSEDLLPGDWNELMADVQYTHPAVTCAVLLEEQNKLSQDLRELESNSEVNHPFPDALESATVMMHICQTASKTLELSETERNELMQLRENAARWGLKHSWLTRQKALFSKHLQELEN